MFNWFVQRSLFFENKDRFVLNDFLKIQELKQKENYASSIKKLLKEYTYSKIYYGVGLAYTPKTEQKTGEHLEKIDFAVFLYLDNTILVANGDNFFC